MLTKNQFDVLTCLIENNKELAQRNISNETGLSLGTVNKTITDELTKDVFSYEINGNTTKIIYPDGATYWWTVTDMGGYGGWSDDYDAANHTDGDLLISLLEQETPKPDNKEEPEGPHSMFGLLFAALGLYSILKPEKAWYFSHGWRYKNAEPSDEALTAERIGGGVMIVFGIIMFLL